MWKDKNGTHRPLAYVALAVLILATGVAVWMLFTTFGAEQPVGPVQR